MVSALTKQELRKEKQQQIRAEGKFSAAVKQFGTSTFILFVL